MNTPSLYDTILADLTNLAAQGDVERHAFTTRTEICFFGPERRQLRSLRATLTENSVRLYDSEADTADEGHPDSCEVCANGDVRLFAGNAELKNPSCKQAANFWRAMQRTVQEAHFVDYALAHLCQTVASLFNFGCDLEQLAYSAENNGWHRPTDNANAARQALIAAVREVQAGVRSMASLEQLLHQLAAWATQRRGTENAFVEQKAA